MGPARPPSSLEYERMGTQVRVSFLIPAGSSPILSCPTLPPRDIVFRCKVTVNIGAFNSALATSRIMNGPMDAYESVMTDVHAAADVFECDCRRWDPMRFAMTGKAGGRKRVPKFSWRRRLFLSGGTSLRRRWEGNVCLSKNTSDQMKLFDETVRNWGEKSRLRKTSLLPGNPRPKIPAAPVSSTLVLVSFIEAKYWPSRCSPASETVSCPIVPRA